MHSFRFEHLTPKGQHVLDTLCNRQQAMSSAFVSWPEESRHEAAKPSYFLHSWWNYFWVLGIFISLQAVAKAWSMLSRLPNLLAKYSDSGWCQECSADPRAWGCGLVSLFGIKRRNRSPSRACAAHSCEQHQWCGRLPGCWGLHEVATGGKSSFSHGFRSGEQTVPPSEPRELPARYPSILRDTMHLLCTST